MRKLKLQVQTTIDGFIAGPNGEMDWITVPWSDDVNQYVLELTKPIDTIVMGRNLAQGFIPYWTSRPANEDPWAVDKFINTPKVVFSNTLEKVEWENTTLAEGNLSEEIAQLKNREGGDIIAYGGASFVASLIKADLVDEYHLFVNPAAIGKGKSIFHELNQTRSMKMAKSIAFDCGIVLLCYHVKE